MLIKTILNHILRFKSFIYEKCELVDHDDGIMSLLFTVRPRKKSKAICSGCQTERSGYDTLGQRRFEFVPLWGIPIFFLYAMWRVECPKCGIVVEKVPWADGKHQVTNSYTNLD